MSNQSDPFSAIRPYHDDEVAGVLQRLIHDDELLAAISRYQFPNWPAWLLKLLTPFVRMALARQVDDVNSVHQFQVKIADYMAKMIARSTTKLTCSGLTELDEDQAYLFISNHRDIAMDPAFVNWVRYQCHLSTVRIAIGDNLLQKPYVSDLMRLNKSFIVNRSAKAPREMLASMTLLSEYIQQSQQQDHSVWIAQREGRAKDGNDRTDPALLKMLYMSRRKQMSFAEAAAQMQIVPVSIAYEFDPCDRAKAIELAALADSGAYEKQQYEDIQSIVKGITGFKGAVHLHFGEVVGEGFATPEALAQHLDEQIIGHYHLHPSNYIAAGQPDKATPEQVAAFEARFAGLDERQAAIMRQMYAAPVRNKQALAAQSTNE